VVIIFFFQLYSGEYLPKVNKVLDLQIDEEFFAKKNLLEE